MPDDGHRFHSETPDFIDVIRTHGSDIDSLQLWAPENEYSDAKSLTQICQSIQKQKKYWAAPDKADSGMLSQSLAYLMPKDVPLTGEYLPEEIDGLITAAIKTGAIAGGLVGLVTHMLSFDKYTVIWGAVGFGVGYLVDNKWDENSPLGRIIGTPTGGLIGSIGFDSGTLEGLGGGAVIGATVAGLIMSIPPLRRKISEWLYDNEKLLRTDRIKDGYNSIHLEIDNMTNKILDGRIPVVGNVLMDYVEDGVHEMEVQYGSLQRAPSNPVRGPKEDWIYRGMKNALRYQYDRFDFGNMHNYYTEKVELYEQNMAA